MEKNIWYDKNYKKLLVIPAILILASIIYMFVFYSNNGDFMNKDISLTGGTEISIYEDVNFEEFKLFLEGKLDNLNTRRTYDLITDEQKSIIIETTTGPEETIKIIEEYLGYNLVEGENADIQFTGSILSESFYKQLIIAIIIAFIFMALVVFLIFKTFVPSMAVIISAFANLLMTLVFINILEIKMSTAGIIAFLMLIGYSVDTDILLTTRMIKRNEGSLNSRIKGAFKTGITMTLTSFFAFLTALLIVQSFSAVLTQIFTILVIGLGFDIVNTWVTNVSILKWYMESKK
jgi:preprotein translocase subunit SecF